MSNFRTKFSSRKRVQTVFSDLPSVTNQQWSDETNINYIIKHCTPDALNNSLRIANSQMAFGEMIESNQQLNLLYEHTKQKEEFNSLPSDIRKEYNYDFKEFLIQSSTQEGVDKLVNLGLLPESYKNVDVPKVDLNNDLSDSSSKPSLDVVGEQIKDL